mgnify:CR=1 FL=1
MEVLLLRIPMSTTKLALTLLLGQVAEVFTHYSVLLHGTTRQKLGNIGLSSIALLRSLATTSGTFTKTFWRRGLDASHR